MYRYDNVTNHFLRITQVQDQLLAIGDKKKDVDPVNVALNGIPNFWETFVT
jgi:hypothetical protein